jgi:hypothetical protein
VDERRFKDVLFVVLGRCAAGGDLLGRPLCLEIEAGRTENDAIRPLSPDHENSISDFERMECPECGEKFRPKAALQKLT